MRCKAVTKNGKMKPTVGRIVHYTNLGDSDNKYPPEQQAAIITKVFVPDTGDGESSISLKIFYSTGIFDMQNVPYSEEYKRGHWSWPKRD